MPRTDDPPTQPVIVERAGDAVVIQFAHGTVTIAREHAEILGCALITVARGPDPLDHIHAGLDIPQQHDGSNS